MKNLAKEMAENEHRKNVEEHNKEMAVTERKQLKYQRLSFVMSMLSCLFTGAMLAVVIIVAMTILPKVDSIYQSTMVSLTNMEKLTDDLTKADLAGTVSNINDLTLQATGDLSNTMDKLNSVDLESLNEAIKNLNNTVEPLAKFFGALR